MKTNTLKPVDNEPRTFYHTNTEPTGKIVIILHFSNLYGANTSLMEYLSHTPIPKENFVVVMPHKGSIIQKLEEIGIPYIVQWFPLNIHDKELSAYSRIWRGVKKLRASFKLFRTIKKLNPVILYSNSSIIYHGFYISRMLRIPHVWHLREFGWEDYRLKHDFSLNVFKNMLKVNSFNIAISNVIAGHYELQDHPRTKVIYNGVIPKQRLLHPGSMPPLEGVIRYGVVGLITPYKNQLNLAKAFHQFLIKTNSKSVFHIIGDSGNPEYFEEIQRYIQAHSLEASVILIGHVSERKSIYGAFDVLLNGAEHEGFGRVTAEAMSFGKVPVAINKGGNAELIEDKVTGLLFDTFESLPAVLSYLHDNPEFLVSLRNKMLTHFNMRFTVEYYCSEIDAVFAKLQPKEILNTKLISNTVSAGTS